MCLLDIYGSLFYIHQLGQHMESSSEESKPKSKGLSPFTYEKHLSLTTSLLALKKLIYSYDESSSVLEQTRQLHKDTASTIDLRESMRLHTFSVKRFLEFIDKTDPKLTSRSELMSRLRGVLLGLDYHDLTSNTLLEQQQNLLSLVGSNYIH
jgi:hypothetical protein